LQAGQGQILTNPNAVKPKEKEPLDSDLFLLTKSFVALEKELLIVSNVATHTVNSGSEMVGQNMSLEKIYFGLL